MKTQNVVIPVGTFVSVKLLEDPTYKYGIVVDLGFWRENVQNDDPRMIKSFDECTEREGSLATPIMLFSEIKGHRRSPELSGLVAVWFKEKYFQRFLWMPARYVLSFNDPEDFFLAMKLVASVAGGLDSKYIESVVLNADEIRKYLEDPNYDSDLCTFLDQALPLTKAKAEAL